MVRDSPAHFVGFLLCATLTGCASLKSRYAMDNPTYAKKYAAGAEKSDVAGKLKQAVDARWVSGEVGTYLSGGAISNPETNHWFGAISYGKETYPCSWASTRLGFEGIGSDDSLYGGVELGLRIQPPTRLAPFAGVGASAGLSAGDIVWAIFTDDQSEINSANESDRFNGIAAVYPEVGVHWWLNGSLRFTVSGRYLISSLGRQHDGWWIGGQIARF